MRPLVDVAERVADVDRAAFEVHVLPGEPEELAAAHPGVGREDERCLEGVALDERVEGAELVDGPGSERLVDSPVEVDVALWQVALPATL